MGRPTKFCTHIADQICDRIANGESMASIGRDESMPGASTVYRWLAENKEFQEMYTRAREDQADTLADEILEIADEDPALSISERGGKEITTVDSAAVAHQRLRIDTRKWIASKLKPRKYGEKIEHAGPNGGPVHLLVSQADTNVL